MNTVILNVRMTLKTEQGSVQSCQDAAFGLIQKTLKEAMTKQDADFELIMFDIRPI